MIVPDHDYQRIENDDAFYFDFYFYFDFDFSFCFFLVVVLCTFDIILGNDL